MWFLTSALISCLSVNSQFHSFTILTGILAVSLCLIVTLATKAYAIVKGNALTKRDVVE